jgi:CBS domain-containing protein
MSKGAWVRTFSECLEQPDESHLIRATVGFDFRPTAGGLALAADLSARIRGARDRPQFMRLMARAASGFGDALGFRGQLATGRDGAPPGRLDIKHGAIIPLVNLVRYHALASGVTVSPTLDRLAAVAGAGGLGDGESAALAEAFEVITRVRFEHHAAMIAAGLPADNLIDPGALGPIAASDLREALQAVKRAQRRLPV